MKHRYVLFMSCFLVFFNSLFAHEDFLKQALQLVRDRVEQKPSPVVRDNKNSEEDNPGPVTTVVLHMVEGFATGAGACVPLIGVATCGLNLSVLDEDEWHAVAVAATTPSWPWMVKYFVEAGDVTVSKLVLKNQRNNWQEVAHRWAKAVGSSLGLLCVWVAVCAGSQATGV